MTDQKKYKGTLHISALFEFELDQTSKEDKKRLERAIEDYLEPESDNAGGLQPDGCLDIDCTSPQIDLAATIKAVEELQALCKRIVPDLDVDVFSIWLGVEEFYPEGKGTPVYTFVVDPKNPENNEGPTKSLTRYETFEYNAKDNCFYQHPTPQSGTDDLIKLEVDQIKFI